MELRKEQEPRETWHGNQVKVATEYEFLKLCWNPIAGNQIPLVICPIINGIATPNEA